jgi:hypothetical protein
VKNHSKIIIDICQEEHSATSVGSEGSREILTFYIAEDDAELLARLIVLVRMLEDPTVPPLTIVRVMYYSHLGLNEREAFCDIAASVVDEIVRDAKAGHREKKKYDEDDVIVTLTSNSKHIRSEIDCPVVATLIRPFLSDAGIGLQYFERFTKLSET